MSIEEEIRRIVREEVAPVLAVATEGRDLSRAVLAAVQNDTPVDRPSALALLLANGWDEESNDEIETALGVMFCESKGYVDAVGDIGLINEKWGPSVGLGQIRTLQEVENWANTPDSVRDIEKLRDPAEQVKAIRVLKNRFGWKQWSVHPDSADRKGRDPNGPEYQCFRDAKGKDFPLLTGHEKADCWSLQGC